MNESRKNNYMDLIIIQTKSKNYTTDKQANKYVCKQESMKKEYFLFENIDENNEPIANNHRLY